MEQFFAGINNEYPKSIFFPPEKTCKLVLMGNQSTFNLTALECIDLGVEQANANDFESARTYFEAAIQLAPDAVEGYSNLGSALQALNLHREAIDIYTRGLEVNPEHIISLYCRGVSFSYLGEWKNAEKDYSEALRLEPDFARAYMGRGYVWKHLGEHGRALEDLDYFLDKAGVPDAVLVPQVMQWKEEMQSIPEVTEETTLDQLFEQAMREVEDGNGTSALSIYSEILNREPTSVEALANRANVYAALKDYRMALIDIRQAIELDANIPILYFNRGNIYQDLGETHKAIEDYQQTKEMAPEIAGAWVQLGKLKETLEKGSGVEDLDHGLELNPYYSEGLLIRSRIYVNQQQYSLALNDLILAADIDPEAPEIFELLDDIMAYYDGQIQQRPQDPFVYISRAKIFHRIGRNQDALTDWNYAVKLDPENPLLLHGRGNLYLDTEQFMHALADFDRAIELDNQNMDFFLDRASALISLGRPDDAMENIDYAIEIAPDKPSYHLFRGILNRMRALYEPAIKDLTQAIELGENSSQVYFERAMSYLGTSQLEEAAHDFEQTLLREESSEVRYDCGLTYLYLGKFDEALQHLDRAIDLIPDYADALADRGWIYLRQGREEEALEDFNHAIQVQPDAFGPWAFRSELYFMQEAWGEAIMDASRALLRDSEWVAGYRIKGIAYFRIQKYREAYIALQQYLQKNTEISSEEELEITKMIQLCRNAF